MFLEIKNKYKIFFGVPVFNYSVVLDNIKKSIEKL